MLEVVVLAGAWTVKSYLATGTLTGASAGLSGWWTVEAARWWLRRRHVNELSPQDETEAAAFFNNVLDEEPEQEDVDRRGDLHGEDTGMLEPYMSPAVPAVVAHDETIGMPFGNVVVHVPAAPARPAARVYPARARGSSAALCRGVVSHVRIKTKGYLADSEENRLVVRKVVYDRLADLKVRRRDIDRIAASCVELAFVPLPEERLATKRRHSVAAKRLRREMQPWGQQDNRSLGQFIWERSWFCSVATSWGVVRPRLDVWYPSDTPQRVAGL